MVLCPIYTWLYYQLPVFIVKVTFIPSGVIVFVNTILYSPRAFTSWSNINSLVDLLIITMPDGS